MKPSKPASPSKTWRWRTASLLPFTRKAGTHARLLFALARLSRTMRQGPKRLSHPCRVLCDGVGVRSPKSLETPVAHFSFCISCVPSVENPPGRPRAFPSTKICRYESAPVDEPSRYMFEDPLGAHSAANLAGAIFLNCTKNTELTTCRFPRTFGLTLSAKFSSCPATA